MLDLLPEDLALHIFSAWLEASLPNLSVLDVAVCSHGQRPTWLLLLPRIVINNGTTGQAIVTQVLWLHDRNVCIRTIDVRKGLKSELWPIPYALGEERFLLPHTTSVQFHKTTDCKQNPTGIRLFLSFFPALTKLDFRCCDLTDAHLLALHDLQCQIRVVCMGGRNRISSQALCFVLEQFSSTLEALDCHGLDDGDMAKLAHKCRFLKNLALICNKIHSGNSLLALCNSNTFLLRLKLWGNAACCITNAMAAQIIKACPRLRTLNLKYLASVTNAVLSTALAHCRDIEQITLWALSIELSNDASQRVRAISPVRAPSMRSKRVLRLETNEQVLARISLPIRSLGNYHDYMRLNQRCLECLLPTAVNLLALYASLPRGIALEHLHSFLSQCPNLITLGLLKDSTNPELCLGDDDLLRLPSHCPKLQTLKLYQIAPYLADECIVTALAMWPKGQLTTLVLDGCTLLTDVILPAISGCCSNLTFVNVRKTKLSKESLLLFAKTMPAIPKTIVISSAADADWIKAELGPGYQHKHVRVLAWP